MKPGKIGRLSNYLVAVLGIIATLITIFVFITGRENLPAILNKTPKPALDCSMTTELGPWPTSGDVLVDARDGWVQADFWSPVRTLKEGFDEVSVIFEPGLKFTVAGVAGTAWKYDRNKWTEEEVQQCTTKHIEDTWKYLKKRYAQITVEELCRITICR